MFSRERDASKVALVHLVARLNAGGYKLLDAQFVTDHLRQFGAVEVARADYHRLLETAIESDADFFAFTGDGDPEAVIAAAEGPAVPA
jgi:leucyl/phenylalanyl-tRNA--protein transferase